MVRDAAATRQRIIAAATTEFATYGLAGARIDSIAANAGANKQLIYAYVGGKEQLFDATLAANLGLLLDSVPFDAYDLPGYARRLRDFNATHPELVRLVLWHNLERPVPIGNLPAALESTRHKLEGVADAQAGGVLDASLRPAVLLRNVLALVHADMLDVVHGPLADATAGADEADDGLEEAVRRLINPTPPRSDDRD